MRKVVLYTLMSLDGAVDHPDRYFAPVGDDAEVPQFDDAMEAFEADVISTQDAVLLGRGMYDEWAGFWPTADYQPFADFINGVTKYVLTSTPLVRQWSGAQAVHEPVADLVRDLKAAPGGNIGVHGSIELARSMLAQGLVDELRLLVGPTVGCGGRRLFADGDTTRRLELLSASATPSSTLLLTYRVANPAGGPA